MSKKCLQQKFCKTLRFQDFWWYTQWKWKIGKLFLNNTKIITHPIDFLRCNVSFFRACERSMWLLRHKVNTCYGLRWTPNTDLNEQRLRTQMNTYYGVAWTAITDWGEQWLRTDLNADYGFHPRNFTGPKHTKFELIYLGLKPICNF